MQKEVKETVYEYKKGKLRSSTGKKTINRKQAVAIGLSEARVKGEKAPRK